MHIYAYVTHNEHFRTYLTFNVALYLFRVFFYFVFTFIAFTFLSYLTLSILRFTVCAFTVVYFFDGYSSESVKGRLLFAEDGSLSLSNYNDQHGKRREGAAGTQA